MSVYSHKVVTEDGKPTGAIQAIAWIDRTFQNFNGARKIKDLLRATQILEEYFALPEGERLLDVSMEAINELKKIEELKYLIRTRVDRVLSATSVPEPQVIKAEIIVPALIVVLKEELTSLIPPFEQGKERTLTVDVWRKILIYRDALIKAKMDLQVHLYDVFHVREKTVLACETKIKAADAAARKKKTV